jgi:hypothetical protein
LQKKGLASSWRSSGLGTDGALPGTAAHYL